MARKGRVDRGLVGRKNAAGKAVWHIRVGVGGGKEKWFGPFFTKTAARQHYEKCKHEQAEERFNPERYRKGKYERLSQIIDRHLEGLKRRTYKDDVPYARWWKERLGEYSLNMITPEVLEAAMRDLEGKPNPNKVGVPKKVYSPQTVLHYMKFLRKVLNIAVRDGKLERSPFIGIKLPKIPTGHTRFLSQEEEDKLLKALGPLYGPWARLAILTGMRSSEQFGMRWAEIDLDRGLVLLPYTKAGETQYVYLNAEAVGILRSLNSWERSVWVFPSHNPASPIDKRNFYHRIFVKAVKETRLEGVTWHTLRHTFASRLAMSGQTEGTIAALLRHSSTLLVRRYAHLSPSHLQNAVETVATFRSNGVIPNRDGTVMEERLGIEGKGVSA